MNPILFKILMTLGIEALKYLRRHYKSMSPEQKAALGAATKEGLEHDRRIADGAGE